MAVRIGQSVGRSALLAELLTTRHKWAALEKILDSDPEPCYTLVTLIAGCSESRIASDFISALMERVVAGVVFAANLGWWKPGKQTDDENPS